MRKTLGRLLLVVGLTQVPYLGAQLAPPESLRLLAEYPIDGLPQGNLSGLARCGQDLLTISDREDTRLHVLNTEQTPWQATEQVFSVPDMPPDGHLPWGMRAQALLSASVRGGQMDFEAIACDAEHNRYVVSEAYASVLRITPEGQSQWLALPENLLPQARARGLLHKHNALYEGLAISPDGKRMWLAAEREQRGLLHLEQTAEGVWECPVTGCVLFHDPEVTPPSASSEASPAQDFSDLVWFKDKLFTLERQQRQICRRALHTGVSERCWSYKDTAFAPERLYPTPYGVAEALWLEDDYAWVGLDNNGRTRSDGEERPIVWKFAAPSGGWLATDETQH